MSKLAAKILDHPDKDEIIAKLVIGQSTKDINAWLKSKYSSLGEAKFIISDKMLKVFQDDYLDIYNHVREDLIKTQKSIVNPEEELNLSVQNNATYKSIMIKTANKQLDVRATITNLCVAIETRFAQVFDSIQADPANINTRIDRLLIDYTEVLGNILEKYYKFTEGPTETTINHNVTLQVVDQHISVFHDVIKEVLSQMDLETSMYFMEVFNDKMSKLKLNEKSSPNVDAQLVEAKILSETINKKLNE